MDWTQEKTIIAVPQNNILPTLVISMQQQTQTEKVSILYMYTIVIASFGYINKEITLK